MANLWIDGFGRYGGDTSKMTNGSSSQAWAEITGALALSAANPRTGTHHLRLSSASSAESEARRVFGAPLSEVYLGFALFCAKLPDAEATPESGGRGVFLAQFRDQANQTQFTVLLGTDGAIAIYQGGENGAMGETLGRTVPIIGAGAYQHIEIYARASATDGAIEIRVDEVTRLNLTGVQTTTTSSNEFSQFACGKFSLGALPGNIDFADFYANDTVNDGSGCHTFIGDCKSGVLMVDSDTAQSDFALSAGSSGYALLDDTPPDDGTFISTSSGTARSDFGIVNVPENTSEILTVRPFVRAQKDDAGSALIAPSMVSGGTKQDVDGQPITTAFAYYDNNVPLNPATSAPWTRAELDAALQAVERVA